MSWELRHGRRCYYRRQRRGGRVVADYFGSGPLAVAAARLDAEHRRERAATLRRREVLRDLERRVDRHLDDGNPLLAAALTDAGLYRHHGSWRRRGPEQASTPS